MDRVLVALSLAIAILAIAGAVLIFDIPVDIALLSGNPGTAIDTSSQSITARYALLQSSHQELSAPNLSLGGVYLSYPGMDPSQIYLVNSSARFGRFTSDVIDEWSFNGNGYGKKVADKGDPFVVISGTIRNDESHGVLWVALFADLYNTKGEKIGAIIRTNSRPEFIASYLPVEAHGTGDFSIMLTYDKKYFLQDISSYNIYLAWMPTATPPP